MGESRGGEGGARRATTSDIGQSLVREYAEDGREVTGIVVSFVTQGLYAVTIDVLHEPTPESFFLHLEPPKPGEGSPTPFGGAEGKGEV